MILTLHTACPGLPDCQLSQPCLPQVEGHIVGPSSLLVTNCLSLIVVSFSLVWQRNLVQRCPRPLRKQLQLSGYVYDLQMTRQLWRPLKDFLTRPSLQFPPTCSQDSGIVLGESLKTETENRNLKMILLVIIPHDWQVDIDP